MKLVPKALIVSLIWTNQGYGFQIPLKQSTVHVPESALYAEKKRVVVIGNGMVGQRFMENLLEDGGEDVQVSTFCEEPRAAYNRVKLTSYFETRNPSDLSMTSEFDDEGKTSWYDENGVELYMKDKAVSIDTEAKTVTGTSGRIIPYDGKKPTLPLCFSFLLTNLTTTTHQPAFWPPGLFRLSHQFQESNALVSLCTGQLKTLKRCLPMPRSIT